MNKVRPIVKYLLILLIFFMLLAYCSQDSANHYRKHIGYLNEVYSKLKNETFHVGKIEGDKIILKDKSFNVIKEIEFKPIFKKVNVIGILSEGDLISFALGGSVDDSYGVLYLSGNSVNMDGLWVLKRITGNAYYYSTTKE